MNFKGIIKTIDCYNINYYIQKNNKKNMQNYYDVLSSYEVPSDSDEVPNVPDKVPSDSD